MNIIPLIACVAASIIDIRRREIPDVLSIGIGVAGLLAAVLGWSSVSFVDSLIAGGLTLLLAIILAWRGGFGGGDVKLLAGLATWLTVGGAIAMLFWTAIVGLLLSFIAAYRGKNDLAYGPAIACGFALAAYAPQLLPAIVEAIRSSFGLT